MKRRDRKVGLVGELSKEMLEAVLEAKPPVIAEAFDHEVKHRIWVRQVMTSEDYFTDSDLKEIADAEIPAEAIAFNHEFKE